jgi:hypothetical protein
LRSRNNCIKWLLSLGSRWSMYFQTVVSVCKQYVTLQGKVWYWKWKQECDKKGWNPTCGFLEFLSSTIQLQYTVIVLLSNLIQLGIAENKNLEHHLLVVISLAFLEKSNMCKKKLKNAINSGHYVLPDIPQGQRIHFDGTNFLHMTPKQILDFKLLSILNDSFLLKSNFSTMELQTFPRLKSLWIQWFFFQIV